MQRGFLLPKNPSSGESVHDIVYHPASPGATDEIDEAGNIEQPMLWDDRMRDRLSESMQSLLAAIRGISMADLGRYSLQARNYCEAWQDSPAGYKLETIVEHDTATSNAWLREEMLNMPNDAMIQNLLALFDLKKVVV